MKQKDYLIYIANKYYDKFIQQGYADGGNNGPHGHLDTPVRNTGHFLIIYTYMYKITLDEKYKKICDVFFEYLLGIQKKSVSGAIKCMENDKFDHLNGLIGQGWTIEAVLYYYDVFKNEQALTMAVEIFKAQKYNFKSHLWERIELDGRNIGFDPTYNHNIWFAACASKILDYVKDDSIEKILDDLLENGSKRDFRIYKNGLLRHSINLVLTKKAISMRIKRLIKIFLYPVRRINLRRIDYRYMEKAYQIFDMYGFTILEEKYGSKYYLFSSKKYQKAKKYALNINNLNKEYNILGAIEKNEEFNVFSYSYNSPTFEYPYFALCNGIDDDELFEQLYLYQEKLMYDPKNKEFTRNNPDILTFNARTYEIIRYLDKKEL